MNEILAYGLSSTKTILHSMTDDLKPQEWDHQPVPGANTAAWIVGHLTLVDRRSLGRLGVTDLPALPEGFEARFTASRTSAGEQKGYGEPRDLISLFDLYRDKLIDAVKTASKELLNKPLDPPHPRFGRIDEMLSFMSIHTAMHLGNLSTIRRALGYPPLF